MSSLNIITNKKFKNFFDVCNYQRKIEFLVLHHVGAESIDDAVKQFKEHRVSAHYIIDEKGKIYNIVSEQDIAYHCGYSYWRGVNSLNNFSIGIEFINKKPFAKKFTKTQISSGIKICCELIKKYKIKPYNIIGHSDIAYNSENGFLDRKQDPSHYFDWEYLAKNGIGTFPDIKNDFIKDRVLFKNGNKNLEIINIKLKLKNFGYLVNNLNDEFNEEMKLLTRVFNRRFNSKKFKTNPDAWYLSSNAILNKLVF
jgi:N-acetylmuramoyl-L-alanine amidase